MFVQANWFFGYSTQISARPERAWAMDESWVKMFNGFPDGVVNQIDKLNGGKVKKLHTAEN